MSTKRRLFSVALTILLAFAALGCTQTAKTSPVVLTFEGANKSQMTQAEFLALDQVTMELSRTNSKGKTTTGTYSGPLFRDVLEFAGVSEYSSILLIASDGYENEYTPDIVNDDLTFFTLTADGEQLTQESGGPVMLCAGNQTANMWAKSVIKVVAK